MANVCTTVMTVMTGYSLMTAAGLRHIPFGKTVTYGWIADQIAKERGRERMSAQAVGGAVGHNPICIIIPCHRVVGSNGSLVTVGASGMSIHSKCTYKRGYNEEMKNSGLGKNVPPDQLLPAVTD